jgi:hypothetical protein
MARGDRNKKRWKSPSKNKVALAAAAALIAVLVTTFSALMTAQERKPSSSVRRQARKVEPTVKDTVEADRTPSSSEKDRPLSRHFEPRTRSRTPAVAVAPLSKETLQSYLSNPRNTIRRGKGPGFVWAPDLAAVHRSRFAGSPDDIIASLGPHVFLKRQPPDFSGGAAVGIPFDPAGPYPVAVRPPLGALGVITGTVFVQVRAGTDLAALAASHGFVISKLLPGVSGGFIRPSAPVDLSAALESIRSDDRVVASELEILYSRVGAR